MNEAAFSGLVSIPEALLLVRQADAATPESALVLPELAREEVAYFRCLVDTADIVEHALVALPGAASDAERHRLHTVLRLRRPLVVSFFERVGPAELNLQSESNAWREAALAAAVVASRQLGEVDAVLVRRGDSRWRVRCRAQGRLYQCDAEPA